MAQKIENPTPKQDRAIGQEPIRLETETIKMPAENALLENLDITPCAGIELPQRMLVNLRQTEGIDPFNLFQEGMDPENENGLSIDNSSGKLEIGLGGFHYGDTPAADPNQDTLTALEYSPESQRYLIDNKYKGRDAYQLLINVDRQEKSAKVWMREHSEGAWSDWAETAVYGV